MKTTKLVSPKTGILAYQKGMTLIELMIASILSVIVIWAVSLTFARTQELNNGIANRTKMQQSVREAINRISNDAKEAGSFGCVALANNASNINLDGSSGYTVTGSASGEWNSLASDGNFTKRYGVGLINKSRISGLVGNFEPSSDGLFFQFGKGSAVGNGVTFIANQVDWPLFTNASNSLFVAANCNDLKWMTVTSVTENKSNGSLTITTGDTAPASSTLMKYVGHLYVIGTYNNVTGLYMLSATAGGWEVELVSPYITSLSNLNYGYALTASATACNSATDVNQAILYTFTNGTGSISGVAPMSVVFDLSAQFIDYKPGQTVLASDMAAGDKGDIVSYEWITAMVREGNVCANRATSGI